eukprot:SAG31_NODE_342_length_17455_cov_6.381251_13_plen_58_part_00
MRGGSRPAVLRARPRADAKLTLSYLLQLYTLVTHAMPVAVKQLRSQFTATSSSDVYM